MLKQQKLSDIKIHISVGLYTQTVLCINLLAIVTNVVVLDAKAVHKVC